MAIRSAAAIDSRTLLKACILGPKHTRSRSDRSKYRYTQHVVSAGEMRTSVEQNQPIKPNALVAYTVVVLCHQHAYLLLQRSATKRLWPNLWSGVGGRVEADEFHDLQSAALREVAEETGIAPADIWQFSLRRVLFHARPGMPLTALLYFTGTLQTRLLPACTEGTLAWVSADQLSQLALIGSTRAVLPLLIADYARDAAGDEALQLGVASFQPDGELETIAWV
jgi:8-oxo-dGTP diphosphatase